MANEAKIGEDDGMATPRQENAIPNKTLDDFLKIDKEAFPSRANTVMGDENYTSLPENSFQSWATLVGVWLIQFCGFGYASAFGVYEDFYVTDYLTNYGTSVISWIGSTQLFILLSIGVISGRLFDKGHFYSVMIFGSVLYVFSLFMLSLCKPQHYYQIFLSQAIGAGIGAGVCFIPSLAILAQHFPKPYERAIVMTIAVSGSSVGGAIHPIMLNKLFNSSVGFANGIRASAGLIAFLSLVALLLMRKNKNYEKEEKYETVPFWSAIRSFMRDPPYVLMISALILSAQGAFFPTYYLQLDSTKHGVNSSLTFYSLTILNGTATLGRVIPGFLSRQIGLMNSTILTLTLCGIVIIGMFGISGPEGIISVAVVYGIVQGAYLALIAPMLTLLADHPSEIGERLGFGFIFQGLGGLIGPPITGALLTSSYIWWRPILYSVCLIVCGIVLLIASRLLLKRKRDIKGCIL